ncbi:hypothetical protein [Salinarimonas rosea]|uniref:hypothetical protein n=1 Tax=Salinarimonas rosea TaxID=552063 RepID=UPI00042617DC|nr:hypothetical protein [Salinarimonas rosea]
MARDTSGTAASSARCGADAAFGYRAGARASLVASALACAGLLGGVTMLALSMV